MLHHTLRRARLAQPWHLCEPHQHLCEYPEPHQHGCDVQVARGIIGCVVVGHYPLNHHPARLALEDLEAWAFDWRSISPALSTCQTVAFVVSSIAVAEVVSNAFGFPQCASMYCHADKTCSLLPVKNVQQVGRQAWDAVGMAACLCNAGVHEQPW